MSSHSPIHGSIKEVLPDIFCVTGIHQYVDSRGEQQHSRNMILVRENDTLSLINTVRLTEEGLKALDGLGKVQHVIRIGAFHGRDDGFYLDRYQAKYWAIRGMKHHDDRRMVIELTEHGPKPFSSCSVFIFQDAREPEGILHIHREHGMLITCDSIKNWVEADEFFTQKTASLYRKEGFFGTAIVSKIWREHCQVQLSDFMRLNQFDFRHLFSAHGEPLLNFDKHWLLETIRNQYIQA